MRIISKKLRDSARGRDCTVRSKHCNFNTETTILAHLPCGSTGMGMKSPDNMAVFACCNCHDAIDGRVKSDITELQLLRALCETQMYWIEQGLLQIQGVKN